MTPRETARLLSALLEWRLLCVSRGYFHLEGAEGIEAMKRHNYLAWRP